MSARSRSRAVLAAGVAAVLPSAVFAGIPSPVLQSEAGQAAFAPPQGAMVLTRTLVRPLAGGAEVVTRRSYRIRFERDGAGYRVEGELAGVEVEAPESLAALAALERARGDEGLFPLLLDGEGRIAEAGKPVADAAAREAVTRSEAGVRAASLAPQDAAQAQAFVAQFRARRVITPWPTDLFRPRNGRSEHVLPVAGAGEALTVVEVRSTAGGLLAWLTRTVTTEFAGDRRTSRETWTLAPAHDL